MTSCRITILCDNSVGPMTGSLGEHGFAALVEHAQGKLLFDTGQGGTLLHNAQRMGKELAQVTQVAISHGHYDHTGGLLPLLKQCGAKELFAHPGIFTPRYRVKDTGECHPIGIPHERQTLEAAGGSFNLATGFREIAPDIFLTGEIPRVTDFEKGDQGIYQDCTGQHLDRCSDDQSLVIATERGLVVLLGCCHAGLVNTLEHLAYQSGRRDIYAVIGGTHLGFCSQEQLEQTIAALRRLAVKKMAVSHCTGFAASARMSRELPQEFQLAMVGYTLEA